MRKMEYYLIGTISPSANPVTFSMAVAAAAWEVIPQ
jgi:hypothetical protein